VDVVVAVRVGGGVGGVVAEFDECMHDSKHQCAVPSAQKLWRIFVVNYVSK
jgi:hypothetical protein